MSAPVKLPRRLPDASPRLDLQEPPADPLERERYWLRRAIRHCKRWGMPKAHLNSYRAAAKRRKHVATMALPSGDGWLAEWLPPEFRSLGVEAMRRRLAELESGAA